MDLFAGVRNTFSSIDKAIGELRNGVTQYNNKVSSMALVQNEILEHAIESEDSIMFLMNLNQVLFEEIREVEGQYSTQDASLSTLNGIIADKEESIQDLENQLAQIKEQALAEANYMNVYATKQVQALRSVQGDLNSGNAQLDSLSARLPQLNERFKSLKRRRDAEYTDLQAKIQRRGNVENSLANLDDQRRQLRQYLMAVETLPLESLNRVQQRTGNEMEEDEGEEDEDVNAYFDNLPDSQRTGGRKRRRV